MAWLAVDQDGVEYIYESKPNRIGHRFHAKEHDDFYTKLPTGSIFRLFRIILTWEDEPIEI